MRRVHIRRGQLARCTTAVERWHESTGPTTLLRAVDDGYEVQADWLLDRSLIAAMDSVIGQTRPEQIRQVLTRLPSGTTYAEVQLFLKCREDEAAA